MAQFRGTMQGMRGETSRLGSKKSGLTARLSGWEGAVVVDLSTDADGRDCATITIERGNAPGACGPSVVLYSGLIDNRGRITASGHQPSPPLGLLDPEEAAADEAHRLGLVDENGERI